MSAAEVALLASLVLAGLWSGLLLFLTTILHPVFAGLSGPDFAVLMRRFLPVARRSATNYVIVIGLVVAPAAALVGLGDRPAGAPFILTAVGLAATLLGPVMASRLLAEPLYDVMLGWEPEAMPPGWQRVRARYFRINWLRGWLTWLSFALFLAALLLEVRS